MYTLILYFKPQWTKTTNIFEDNPGAWNIAPEQEGYYYIRITSPISYNTTTIVATASGFNFNMSRYFDEKTIKSSLFCDRNTFCFTTQASVMNHYTPGSGSWRISLWSFGF